MKVSLTLLFCIFSFVGFSQNPTVMTVYYDKAGKPVDLPDDAEYYTVDSMFIGESSTHSYYAKSNKIRSIQPRSTQENSMLTQYYESGGTSLQTSLYYGRPFGVVKTFYEDGKPMAEVEFVKKEQRTEPWKVSYAIRQYWDSLGNKVISDGNGSGYIKAKPLEQFYVAEGSGKVVNGFMDGSWKGTLDEGATYEEVYDNGKLVKGTQKRDGKTYHYTEILVEPQPEGGIPGLMKFISNNLVYPKSARRRGTEGTVLTEFYVNEDGSVSDIKTIKGISGDCDAEGRRIVSLSKWKPGTQRGKPVRVRYVLPLRFVLG